MIMAQHKWHKEIKAWADGQTIQSQWQWAQKDSPAAEWFDNHKPDFDDVAYAYRIKPQPKEPQYLYVYYNNNTLIYELDARDYLKNPYLRYIGKIKLEVDDEAN